MMIAAGAARPVVAQTVTFQELYTFNGDNASDYFGSAVSDAGDVNGDGFDDLIVGAWGDDNNGSSSGSAIVFSGADGSVLLVFNGDNAGDYFGLSVSGAGDVNGDGFDDLIVGAYRDDNYGSDSGSARVFSGIDGSVLFTFNGDSTDDQFGRSVSGAGDVNGDGFEDLIVGARGDDNNGNNSGSARVFSGVDGSVLFTVSGDGAGDLFGCSVSGAGDVNGDGFDDLIVGAWGDDNYGFTSGSARVISGVDGSVLFTFYGNSTEDRFGYSVADAGDVNGDGLGDVVVGAYRDAENIPDTGSIYVYSGANGAELYCYRGEYAGLLLGISVSGAGDVNADGFGDIVAGAVGGNTNGFFSGSARMHSGTDGTALVSLNGENANDRFGIAVSSAGDVNGDGFDDIIVGADRDDNNGTNSGSARVFISVVTPPERLCADQNGDGQVTPADFSAWVANFNAMSLVADVNRDGLVTPADFSAWIAAFNQGENGPTCVP